MRYKLEFELENEEIPIQYRKSILSFIKLSLSENNQEYYEKYYKNKDCIIKPYTFVTIFQSPQFKKDTINLQNHKETGGNRHDVSALLQTLQTYTYFKWPQALLSPLLRQTSGASHLLS